MPIPSRIQVRTAVLGEICHSGAALLGAEDVKMIKSNFIGRHEEEKVARRKDSL